MKVESAPGIVAEVVTWRDPLGQERLTVVAKAIFGLVLDELARLLVADTELAARDRVPWKPKADVVLYGRARSAERGHVLVRLALARGLDVLLAKEQIVTPGEQVAWERAVGATVELSADTEPTVFQAAPEDLRVGFLRGGEQILVEGLLAGAEASRFRLPALAPLVSAGQRLPMVGDTIVVDVERMRCELTWRGVVPRGVTLDREPVRVSLLPLVHVEEVLGCPAAWAKPPGGVPSAEERQRIPLLNETPLSAASIGWCRAPARWHQTLIVKGTFDIRDDAKAELSTAQAPLSGDVPGAKNGQAIDYATDVVPFKPQAEVFVAGFAHAPKGQKVALVTLTLGDVQKDVAAMGPRRWTGDGVMGEPGVFAPVPLTYAQAFGGEGFAANPAGTGFGDSPPPRLERPGSLLRRRGDRAEPACMSPIPADWPSRKALLGQLDPRSFEAQWPALPDSIDMAYFQSAPADQRCKWLRGDESFAVTCVRPGGEHLRGVLPGICPQAFVRRADGEVTSLSLRLDTVTIDTEANTLTLVWRAVIDVADEDASDLLEICLQEGKLGEIPDPTAAWASMMTKRDRRFTVTRTDEAPRSGPLWVTPVVFASVSSDEPPPVPLVRAPQRRDVQAWIDADTLAGRDLSRADLSELDFSQCDLTGAILAGARLDGCRFDEAKLHAANSSGAKGSRISFRGADLSRADLSQCELSDADFTGVEVTRASFADATVSRADFSHADGAGVCFAGATVLSGVFDEAKLAGADWSRARLEATRFRAADLSRSKWIEAEATGLHMDGAKLERAQLTAAKLEGAVLTGIAAADSTWEAAQLTGATFVGADLQQATLSRARLDKADFTGASLPRARLDKATLTGATLVRCDLMQAILERADLRHVDASDASLFQASVRGAQLSGANLTGAHLAGTGLSPRDRR